MCASDIQSKTFGSSSRPDPLNRADDVVVVVVVIAQSPSRKSAERHLLDTKACVIPPITLLPGDEINAEVQT